MPPVKAVTDVDDRVNRLLARHWAKDSDLGLVAADDAIMKVLAQMGLAKEVFVTWKQLSFHHTNRDGVLGHHSEIHDLMADIRFVGWSDKAVSHALCVQAEPGNSESEDATRAWVEASSVPMAPVVPGTIMFNTLSCGHTTQGMRCIDAKVECRNRLLGDGTHYDAEVIRKTDPLMAEAVKGITWTVLDWKVGYMYPKLFGMLSSARNVGGHLARSAHEVQGISQMFKLWSQSTKEGVLFDYDGCKRSILRQKPFFAEDLDDFYAFLHARAGGVDGFFWYDFVKFHKRFVTPSLRTMAGDVYRALADFPFQRLAYALLKAGYTCPKECLSGRCATGYKPEILRA